VEQVTDNTSNNGNVQVAKQPRSGFKLNIENKYQVILALTGAVLLYAILRLSLVTGIINPYWQRVMFNSMIVMIASLGLCIIYGFTGQFSLGHAAFIGLGAFSAGLFTKTFGQYGVASFVVAIIIGACFSGLVGLLIGLPVLRLKSDYLGIATLGLAIIVKVALDNGNKLIPALGGATGMTGVPQMANLEWLFGLAVLAIILTRNFVWSSYGRACTSVREDETAADVVGINTFKTKLMAFTIGCALAGLAGGLYAHTYPYICPTDFDFMKCFDYLIIVVLGGLGSMSGTVVTAVGWVFLFEVLRLILGQQFMDFRGVIYALILIIIILVRRQGLFGGYEFGFLVPQVRREAKADVAVKN
jgi:branched-chain amino acid transport system permease protein